MESKNLLTIVDVCKRYDVSLSTIYSWTSKNIIPHLKIRGMIRFRESDLDTWDASHLVSTGTKLL